MNSEILTITGNEYATPTYYNIVLGNVSYFYLQYVSGEYSGSYKKGFHLKVYFIGGSVLSIWHRDIDGYNIAAQQLKDGLQRIRFERI